jgi:hypothetical protein
MLPLNGAGERSSTCSGGELPLEKYSPERRAKFLLTNATNAEDYANACEAVRKLGLDPEAEITLGFGTPCSSWISKKGYFSGSNSI